MPSITPCLWFDDDLEEAIDFYRSVFPDVVVHTVNRKPDGSMFTAHFEIAGQPLMGLNGGPHFRFTEAISLAIDVEGQDEIDHYWGALTADGGEESQCGWCKDRFGLSWQIIPAEFTQVMESGTPEEQARVMAAVLTMRKPDLAAIQAARKG